MRREIDDIRMKVVDGFTCNVVQHDRSPLNG